ncbi:hypothetical protein CVT26_012957 [Gymnopilus dilepis]|uniref:Uncharacterized protein n=1 Tax=Gymnopilus dilepis TaxID=231916 RepID=A0A409WD67_9AGAR|nr:hypothetical protein CVT26_012957 [Gymnopilus dilepis]
MPPETAHRLRYLLLSYCSSRQRSYSASSVRYLRLFDGQRRREAQNVTGHYLLHHTSHQHPQSQGLQTSSHPTAPASFQDHLLPSTSSPNATLLTDVAPIFALAAVEEEDSRSSDSPVMLAQELRLASETLLSGELPGLAAASPPAGQKLRVLAADGLLEGVLGGVGSLVAVFEKVLSVLFVELERAMTGQLVSDEKERVKDGEDGHDEPGRAAY